MKYYPLLLALCFLVASCDASEPIGVNDEAALTGETTLAKSDNFKACWGQASAVFAATGELGEHASQEETPRFGLRNLARALYDAGVIPDDSMQSLGVFVANELGLSIDACTP